MEIKFKVTTIDQVELLLAFDLIKHEFILKQIKGMKNIATISNGSWTYTIYRDSLKAF